MPETEAADEGRVLTLPNVLSLVRLLCVPLFLWLLFGRHDRGAAAYLLGALGATDWVDGYVARHWNQVSTVGKVLDPAADRVLLAVGVIAILVDGAVPAWIGWATIVREVGISVAVLVLAALGARRIDVQWAGKAGTLAMMVAYPLFLLSRAHVFWRHEARVLAWLFVVPGLVIAWYAAVTYVPLARRALAEGRLARGAASSAVGSSSR
ncbi:MAG: CDP-alcohol phosphatidyltransferase family protein [Actinobacteria bacterium]|nr:MAG: CDP-alcohol phosphatidyltransferase family protein [Actinomycetota bacterium]